MYSALWDIRTFLPSARKLLSATGVWSASERGNTMKYFENFNLKAQAKIWP
jgi:hypothetical protein